MEKIRAFFATILAFFASLSFGIKDAPYIDPMIYEMPGNAYECAGDTTIAVHDPSLFKAKDGTYYVTGSHIASAKSDDLVSWNMVSTGVFDSNRTLVAEGKTLRGSYSEIFTWEDAYQTQENYEQDKWETNVWASDIIYNKQMGKYCYYASSSVWGQTRSVIFFATSDNPEGPYDYVDAILYSGWNAQKTVFGKAKNSLNYRNTNIEELIKDGIYTRREIEKAPYLSGTGKYSPEMGKAPNCIDPHAFYDKDGNMWLVFGSWSGGIYVLPIDEASGKPDWAEAKKDKQSVPYFGRMIARSNDANEGSGEGPYITYDPQSDYYYFFETNGGLNALDGYNMRMYRSKKPNGPYTDIQGNDANTNANTGIKINGNYRLDGRTYLSGGHNSVFIDDDGKAFNCYHVRFGSDEYFRFETTVHQMLRNADGWLCTLPTDYKGETATPLTKSDIAKTYTLFDFGSITVKGEEQNIIAQEQTVTLNDDGTISGFVKYTQSGDNTNVASEKIEGTWALDDGTYFISFTLGDTVYNGVGAKTVDGRMTLSLIGTDNSSIWAVEKI